MRIRTKKEYPKGLDMYISRNFRLSEFECKCNRDTCKTTVIDTAHVAKLQVLRDNLGPIKITSGYRCEEHNADVGGSPTSKHKEGLASDLVPLKAPLYELVELAEKVFKVGGLGEYPGKGFVHVDSRNTTARW